MKYFYIKPRKINRLLEEDEVDDHRRFDCIFYDHCLDHARIFRYISFSCKKCNHCCEKSKIISSDSVNPNAT